ncbi:MAG: FAD-binding protein [Chitinophagales bacterium]|nr:FAD-binding protein [Chitinophagaceae bacterium]MCB9065266.1 FAD-binding protein [Chitinophagales bacterium]
MRFKKPDEEDIAYFKSVVGDAYVFRDGDVLNVACSDETEDLVFIPEVVIRPCSTDDVSKILSYCNNEQIAITPRGAGTGLSGGALAVHGGVVLDMKKFDKIIKLDKENFQVTVQPGVITQVLQEYVSKEGLFYPPDPASKGSCFIGGNIAENSGGPKAAKYGVVKDYVLNLEMVLPDGKVIWTGANVLKNATGYNLTQLVVGSEGTLGVVTKIVLKLIPAVQYDLSILIPFHSAEDACKAVNTIMLAGIVPSALEFMERDALDIAQKYTSETTIAIPDDVKAHLLVEVDGNDMDALYAEVEKITALLEQYETGEILLADNKAQKDAIWALRRKVGEAVKSNSIYKEEDTVVPRAKLPQLLMCVKRVGGEYGFKSVCYGHAGDGNLHVNIIKGDMDDDKWNNELPVAITKIFKEVVAMGGTISGEHGIGLVQKGYMHLAFDETQLGLMKGIKNLFDPNGIMNPGKIFD